MFERELHTIRQIIKKAELHNFSELSDIEFKTNFPSPESMHKELGEQICAMANRCTYDRVEQGYIVIGVEDGTGRMLGTDIDVFDLKYGSGNQDFEMWLRSKLVGADFEMKPCTSDGKKFLLIKVGKSYGRIATFDKQAFFRIGRHVKKLLDCSQEIQDKMVFSVQGNLFWGREIRTHLSTREVLDLLDWSRYYTSTNKVVPENNELIFSDFTDEGFLKSEGAGIWTVTYLGGLVLAKDFNTFDVLSERRIRVITYDGTTKLATPIQDIFLSKGYGIGFPECMSYIKSQIPEVQIITGGVRQNIFKYPEVAIREFLANCLVHQDFLEGGINPTVEIYTDRVEFINAGNCIVDIMRIVDSVPKARNEKLVDIMRRMNICEFRGSGIDRSIEALRGMRLPMPGFENKPTAFIVRMYSFREYNDLTEEQKMNSCYLYTCHAYLQGQRATNKSLREMFGVKKDNYPMMSRLIGRCIKAGFIKEFNPQSGSKKFKSYIPSWAG